jgi:ATP-dependent helicase YprA (DUF1998 family)
MLNPVLYTEKVLSDFLKYQLTTYRFADRDLYEQMRELLSLEHTRNTPLFKGPYVSLSRIFQEGATVTQLVQEKILHSHLQNLIPYPRLYGHQETAIRSIQNGQPTLVSTGTGSGKTECFLYPTISHCLDLKDRSEPEGITAVIVYPMNALAEDQLGRLRELLAGTGITFGMYVGKSPENASDASGKRLPQGSSNQDYQTAIAKSRNRGKAETFYPPEERVSREEMRAKPPRILLTNIKQLELLLTRQQDVELFNNVQLQYLVFDEAHTFSGAAGAETACLIRRLKTFCQYQNPHKNSNPVCIATSATIADPEKGKAAGADFAARFFGVDPETVTLVGEEYQQDTWQTIRTIPPSLGDKAQSYLKAALTLLDQIDDDATNTPDTIKTLLRDTAGYQIDVNNWQESLYHYLTANELVYQLAQILTSPKSLKDLIQQLQDQLGRSVDEPEVLFWLALGSASRCQSRPLLRPVIHGFVRGVGGAVVTFPKPTEGDREQAQLWLSSEDVDQTGQDTLYRLPVTSCSTCGQHYYVHHVGDFRFLNTDDAPRGGRVKGTRQSWEPLSGDQGGQRILLVDRLITADEDENPGEHPDSTALVYFCRHCGTIHSSPLQRGEELDRLRCDHCGALGDLFVLQVVDQKEGTQYQGKLRRCIACGTQGRSPLGTFREPNKPIRATTVSDVHVLAQNLIHHAERRRLLIFADNRQDAAFQAGWMQDHARRYRFRALMNQKIQDSGGISIGDLTSYLDQLLETDNDLSESLAPEVWQVARKEAAGKDHQDERKYFLRIQILREITMGLKQRLGLEPWGRLKVEYPDLQVNLPFIQHWSDLTVISPNDLCNGIAALLDVTRRKSILLDKEGWIYSKYWQDGDREIQRGYLPLPQGVPMGLRLTRDSEDNQNRVNQWLSTNGLTGAMECCNKWGIPVELRAQFLTELWELLTETIPLLQPISFTNSSGRALRGCQNVYQIDGDRLKLTPHQGLYRCQTCRRTHLRPTPNLTCLAYRCNGSLVDEPEDANSYDLMVLDQEFSMIRPREHSAQVPTGDREIIENMFRNERNERINTLVCTPTLEMGVNIGALDAVLMRNVPPLPANYWQRAGRAGRQHRMAVNLTYCRGASHDRAYFQDPLKLLNGTINPPKFNLRNEVMLAKHIHAAILTGLQQLVTSQELSSADSQQIQEILKLCFPSQVKSYLFDEEGNVRPEPLNIEPLRSLIQTHQDFLQTYLERVLHQDPVLQDLINAENIKHCISTTTDELTTVIRRVWKRLQWAIAELDRLDEVRRRKGTLNYEEDETQKRCDRLIKQLKGQQSRKQREAEGFDETNTFSVLASEGFLPGYGLDTGSIKGTFLTPRTIRLRDFTLNRPLATALREYIPGNMIYANSHRFFARKYQIDADSEFIPFQIDLENEVVTEISASSLHTSDVVGLPLNNVDLRHQSQISDDENYRFQLAVSTLGYEQQRHGEGIAYRWGNKNLLLKRANHLRLVNIGPSQKVSEGELGYPFCRVCGQSRSPLSSQTEINHFQTTHQDYCNHTPQNLAFYADIIVDTLTIQDCPNRETAYSLAETLRMGAAQILEMEIEDLQIITFGQPGQETVDVALYDPMPGGSGLLEQILEAWTDITSQALAIAHHCPTQCTDACIDCLKTYRNAFYHRYLNRHTATQWLHNLGHEVFYAHEIPAVLPKQSSNSQSQPVNDAEAFLQDLFKRAGFPTPKAQHPIPLGKPLGTTRPDFFFEDPEETVEGVCIYLDGLSENIHGNPERQQLDQAITDKLEALDYEVFRIAASELWDQNAMAKHFSKIARTLLDKQQAKVLKTDQTWYQTPTTSSRDRQHSP